MSEAAPPAVAPPWKLRLIHTITQVATLVMVWWFISMGRLYGTTFRELDMTSLPAFSGFVIRLSDVLMQPGVLIVGGAAVLALIVVGHFGLIDRALVPLIGVDVLVIAFLMAGWLVGLQGPMRKIQETLTP